MTVRRDLIFVSAVTSCAAIYFLFSLWRKGGIMSSGNTGGNSSTERQSSTEDLIVLLAKGESEKPPSIRVTIQNINPRHPLTFLKWDSPFDPSSLNSGGFTLLNASTGDEIPSPGLKVSRMVPPPREDLVEVPPQQSISQELKLKAPWIPSDGRPVKVHAQGHWRAVWPKAKSEVKEEELQAMGGKDVMKGEFQSSQALELRLSDS